MIAHGERAAAEAERLRGPGRGAGAAPGRRCPRCSNGSRRRRPTCRRAPARRRAGLGGAVDGVLVELGFPAGVFEVGLGRRPADRRRAGGRDRRRRARLRRERARPGRLPPRPERGRAGPAAGADRVGRRAEPGRAGDQAGPRRGRRHARPSCSTRSTPASAAGAPTRSAAACGPSRRRHQVLCVTHLPQIAAHADAHFRIAKRERDGRTVTEVDRARPRGPDRGARPRCSAARPRRRARRRSPRRASCSIGPRRGERAGRELGLSAGRWRRRRASTAPSTTT